MPMSDFKARLVTNHPIGPLGEPYDARAWSDGVPPCGPCGRGEHDGCKVGFHDLAGYRECYCPVCYPRP